MKGVPRGYLDYENVLKYRILAANNRCVDMATCSRKIHSYFTRIISLQINDKS